MTAAKYDMIGLYCIAADDRPLLAHGRLNERADAYREILRLEKEKRPIITC
jgi:hypothetical protein